MRAPAALTALLFLALLIPAAAADTTRDCSVVSVPRSSPIRAYCEETTSGDVTRTRHRAIADIEIDAPVTGAFEIHATAGYEQTDFGESGTSGRCDALVTKRGNVPGPTFVSFGRDCPAVRADDLPPEPPTLP